MASRIAVDPRPLHSRVHPGSRSLELCVLAAGLVLFLVPLKAPLNVYDEGLALLNAARVLDGDVPFRDYWSIYPPGQSYVLAGVFHLFGTDVATARIYDSLVRFATAIGVFALTAKLTSRGPALALYTFACLLLASAGFYGYAVFPALLFDLFGLLAFVRYLESRRAVWLLWAGAAIGIASAFRLDLGAYAGLGTATALGLFALGSSRSPERPSLLSSLAMLVAGAGLILVPFYGWLAAVASPVELWNDLVVFPSTVYHEVRRVSYPPLRLDLAPLLAGRVFDEIGLHRYSLWLGFYLPPAVYAITVATVAPAFLRRTVDIAAEDLRARATAMAVAGLGIGLYAKALGRFGWLHLLPTLLTTSIAAAWLLRQTPRRFWRRARLATPAAVLLTIVSWPFVVVPVDRLLVLLERYPPTGCYSELERAGCVPVAPHQERAIRYVRERTREDESIFVGNGRHDLLFVNDIAFYFLADRPSVTKYHELHPGLANTLPVQQAMIAELVDQEVTWIVTRDWERSREPNASAISSGVQVLDEFIESHYESVERYGPYQIWRREPSRSSMELPSDD